VLATGLGLIACWAAVFPGMANGLPLELSDGSGREAAACSDLRRHGRWTGGCRLLLRGEPADLTVMTPFGEFRFVSCQSTLTIRVGARGRGWVVGASMSGATPCGDVRPCPPPGADLFAPLEPWPIRLRVRSAKSLLASTNACFETCIGTIRGKLDIALDRSGSGWRAASRGTEIGSTSVELDGRWTVEADRFLVRSGG
jgi:hypothetical protein